MPDAHGFLHLSDAPETIAIECAACNRHGRYSRDRAIAQYGDMSLPDFLAEVGAKRCAVKSPSDFRPCQARYTAESLPG